MRALPKLTPAQSTYLDFLRAVAAMSVLFGHAADMFLENSWLYHMGFQSGGVLVFFLMSGFLISYSVFRRMDHADYGFREYFIDRFCRIYCAFLPALIFVWLIDMHTIDYPVLVPPERLNILSNIRDLSENFNVLTWVGNLFMMQDFPLYRIPRLAGFDSAWFVGTFGSAGPFWTISIEWWIYMTFGMIVILLLRRWNGLKAWQWILLGFVMIMPAYFMIGGPIDHLTFLWIFGMIACLAFFYLPSWLKEKGRILSRINLRLLLLSATAASVAFMFGRMYSLALDKKAGGTAGFIDLQFSFFLTIAIFAMLFFFGTFNRAPRIFEAISKFVADYSYSLYLVHVPIMTFLYMKYPGNDHNSSFFWASIVLGNVVAIVFWWLFERHYHAVAKWLKIRTGSKGLSV